jgi:hypothetical protein
MNTRAQNQVKPGSSSSVTPVASGALQRKCGCGTLTLAGAECGACARAKHGLQRASLGARGTGGDRSIPSIVHDVLRSPGQPLDAQARSFFEPRFGHDLSQVRVHTDTRAVESARAVNAIAYTAGRSVVFGAARYTPGTSQGRRLLAHELTHVLQQTAGPASPLAIEDSAQHEAEADRNADHMTSDALPRLPQASVTRGVSAGIQRKMEVNDPGGAPAGAPVGETNESIVRGHLATLCPAFTSMAGQVVPTSAASCAIGVAAAPPSTACACLCTMHGLMDPATGADITWTIDVNDADWPHTDPATRTVTVHSPYSGVQFGAWSAGPPPHRMTEPNWLVLGHELCGHARLFALGTHPTGPPPTHGGRPEHDVTVGIENTIAAEHGVPATELRGLFADPHHGESLARVTVAEFPYGSASVRSLPPAQAAKISLAQAFIASAPVKMDVIGHTDQQGTSTTLGRARANSIRAALDPAGRLRARFLHVDSVVPSDCPAPGDQPSCRKVDIFMFMNVGASETHR